MKYSRLIFFIGAMLTLHCSHLLAQLKIDSVVFHLDSLPSSCFWQRTLPFSPPEWGNDSEKISLTSQFIVKKNTTSHDSTICVGVGTSISGVDTSSAILILVRDSNFINFHYTESLSPSEGSAFLRLDIRMIILKNVSGKSILLSSFATNKSELILERERTFRHDDSYSDDTCYTDVNFSDSSRNSIIIYGNFPSVVKKENFVENTIYPNPASNFINIPCKDAKLVDIFDMLGRRVLSLPIMNEDMHVLDISKLALGCYWLKVGDRIEKLTIVR